MRDEASAPPAGPWSDAYPLRRGFTARRLQPRAGGLRHPPDSVPRPEGAGCTRHRAAGAPGRRPPSPAPPWPLSPWRWVAFPGGHNVATDLVRGPGDRPRPADPLGDHGRSADPQVPCDLTRRHTVRDQLPDQSRPSLKPVIQPVGAASFFDRRCWPHFRALSTQDNAPTFRGAAEALPVFSVSMCRGSSDR